MEIFGPRKSFPGSSWLPRKLQVVNTASDCCRLCRSPGNLVEFLFKGSNREGSLDDVLALMCQNIGLTLVNLPSLSERMCNPCAQKIRNLCRLYNEIQAVTTSREAAEVSSPVIEVNGNFQPLCARQTISLAPRP